MSAQASSSASERVFSTAGWPQNPLRKRLSPSTPEQLPLLQSAFKNNIDLRKDVAELHEARMKRANEKRSATAALANAAKKHAAAPPAAAAAGSDAAAANAVPVVVDGNAPDDDDGDAVLEDWAQATSGELPPPALKSLSPSGRTLQSCCRARSTSTAASSPATSRRWPRTCSRPTWPRSCVQKW
jgi:hypothetical protein